MAIGNDVVDAVTRLYASRKQPVSIDDVAKDLGRSTSEIQSYVEVNLKLSRLEGTVHMLEPGRAQGLF